jgi:hypothetical protein
MGPLNNRTVNSVSIRRLDLRLAQIAESVARELQMEKGVQQVAENMVDNKRRQGSDQIKQVDDRGITSDSPGGANKATSKRAARRRLKWAREEGKARLIEGKRLQGNDIKVKKDKSKFKRRARRAARLKRRSSPSWPLILTITRRM